MDHWSAIWEAHKGKIVGIAGGFAVGLLILRYGFWRTAFVAGLVALGFWFGSMVDREGWRGVTERVERFVQRDR